MRTSDFCRHEYIIYRASHESGDIGCARIAAEGLSKASTIYTVSSEHVTLRERIARILPLFSSHKDTSKKQAAVGRICGSLNYDYSRMAAECASVMMKQSDATPQHAATVALRFYEGEKAFSKGLGDAVSQEQLEANIQEYEL